MLHDLRSLGPVTRRNTKAERLKALKSLNRHPERVRAPWFQTGSFFDAQDLVHQVRDGAPCEARGRFQGRGRRALWPLPSGVLSG